MNVTIGWSEEICPGFAAGCRRYENSDKEPLWRITIARHAAVCTEECLVNIDATTAGLVKLKTFCEKALECLRTDGGRLTPTLPTAAEAHSQEA